MPPDILAMARRDYLENQAMVTSPTEVVQMLYQVAIDNVLKAIEYLKAGDAMSRARVVTKAEEAVDELILALDHSVGAQFTRTLADLYVYILQQLVTGHARQSEQAFRDALTILESLSETWSQVRTKLSEEAEAANQSSKDAAPDAEPDSAQEVTHDIRDSYSAYSGACVAIPGRDWSA
jgi:flagellar biosynthetic protein FliS